jgi:hypothetical protein
VRGGGGKVEEKPVKKIGLTTSKPEKFPLKEFNQRNNYFGFV